MAYTTINKSSLNFNTKLYTGNGGTNAQTGVGFKPDLTWIKNRTASGEGHHLYDVVRGVTKRIRSDTNAAESTVSTGLTTFGTDGFTVGNTAGVNGNGNGIVAWNWKAGTAVSGNTTGSGTYKSYSGSVNTTAGFSIIKYTGNGAAGHTIPHRLGVTPSTIFVKMTSDTGDWSSYHSALGNTKYMRLSGSGTSTTSSTYWNNTSPNSTNFTVGTTGNLNGNNSTFIAYCFADVKGYSKMSGYTGNANTNGTFVYTGFKPTFVMFKATASNESWQIYDTKRNPANALGEYLNPNNTSAAGNNSNFVDYLSNGFKLRTTDGGVNSSQLYVYMAFGQSLVGSNGITAKAR